MLEAGGSGGWGEGWEVKQVQEGGMVEEGERGGQEEQAPL